MTNSKEFLRRNILIPLYLVSFGIWDPTGYDLGLVGNVSQCGDVGLVGKYRR